MIFTASIVTGMAAGNAGTTTLLRSIYAFLAAWFIGSIVGGIADRTISRNVEQYKKDHPIPQTHADILAANQANAVAGDEESGKGEGADERVDEVLTGTDELTSRPAA